MGKADRVVKIIFSIILFFTFCLVIYAVTGKNVSHEAYIGSFEAQEIPAGWNVVHEDGSSRVNVTLPYKLDAKKGQVVSLTGKLPDNIRDGMRLCMRSTMQEITVYIDGKERGHYRPGHSDDPDEVIVSGYFLVDLYG